MLISLAVYLPLLFIEHLILLKDHEAKQTKYNILIFSYKNEFLIKMRFNLP